MLCITPGDGSLEYRVYCYAAHVLRLTDQTGPTLDAVSLHLPNGAYTTLRTYDTDRIVGLSAHLQRLIESSALLQRPYPIDPAAIRSALRDVIARERQPALRVRLTVPLDVDQIFISVEPFEVYPPEFYQHGVRCATTRLSRQTPQAKSTDFIAPSRESKAAIDPGIHELLIVNRAGEILEGISSNFYAVLDGVLRTAGEEVLEGITRRIVLQEAAVGHPERLSSRPGERSDASRRGLHHQFQPRSDARDPDRRSDHRHGAAGADRADAAGEVPCRSGTKCGDWCEPRFLFAPAAVRGGVFGCNLPSRRGLEHFENASFCGQRSGIIAPMIIQPTSEQWDCLRRVPTAWPHLANLGLGRTQSRVLAGAPIGLR